MFYSDAERTIYQSPLGHSYDPLAVQRKLRIASRGQFNALLIDWQGEEDFASAVAEEALVIAAREAFEFVPFDEEGGVTDAQVIETLTHFTEYLAAKKPSAEPPPNSPVSSACHS